MATIKSKSVDAVLGLCHKATVLGNKISIRMIEFLSSVKHLPNGFDDLARDFLDMCRIMWSIEAGLGECSRGHQKFPREMIQELDKKFKTTQADLQTLDQLLGRFLEYERRGTVGKIQRGWRNMFADNDISKMRDSLNKTREALRMSALVFEWSFGDERIDESVGFGYTGLVAALERLSPGRPILETITRMKTIGAPPSPDEEEPPHHHHHHHHHHNHDHDQALSVAPSLTPIMPIEKISASDFSSFHARDHETLQVTPPELRRHTSISNATMSSHALSHRITAITADEHGSGGSTESDTVIDDGDSFETGPNKVVRLKADPQTMPRWTPRNTAGANTPTLRAGLISAVQQRNTTQVEHLLDRGVSPDTGPDVQVLKEAILRHDSETVRLLLTFGADPNVPDKLGVTPLFAAVEESFLDGATMLLMYGADSNLAAGSEPESPLALSIIEDKVNFARLLLTYGGDANHVMTNGETLLIKAIATKRSRKLIDLMLDYGSEPNGKNREGKTPLFEAITSGRVDIVTSLLDHGANPNLPGPKHMLWPSTYQPACLKVLLARGADPKKTSGIMELATSINNLESVHILLKAGVDPNAKKDGIYTPLCTSIRDNRADVFQLLLANGADPNEPASEYPAFKCVTHLRPQFLAPLVAAGANLNSPKGILETAVVHNNVEALKWLLENGVSPNDKVPKTGATPLTSAIRDNKLELVDLLLSHGADPNVRGQDWPVCMAVRQPAILKRLLPALAEPRAFKGVMEMAVVANQLDSVKLLLEAGVSVEDRNGGVFSPLTTAIRERHKGIVKYLLNEGGADPNAPGEHLPIVKALRRMEAGDMEIIEMLLSKGADPNKVYRGHNAVIQALENGDATVLKLLIDRCGADLDAQDETGRTVIEIAGSRGWEEATSILLSGGRKR
ncbi:ankyrin repeat-containing domain protein [Pseudomassariella vexata]|uniref:Ankyrin repeat-containing domain protein n=1 Tax=Pseudomassariella vexata TaxID=1141098 RepID=A0A1Y2DAM7_9PEZI|nr:ankyrin repeat-containing domain protein [Pseudomassariella vexata]ORY56323.1 ankyrin repeat-containing domain protein [Pseudomassariella vexata]